ncbi:CDP-glycerol glycerophosphotransferase family protein [Vibrio vulnificus]|nr:CDP-glycerol glycerophosphotransferase family protein [Vibrio vulnificus]
MFGSGNCLFENNIEIFFKFVRKKEPNIKLFFVTNKMEVLYPELEGIDTLLKGSVKSYFYAFLSEVLVFDTGNSDICPGFLDICSAVKVNVNHGQEGLKILPSNYYKHVHADIHCAVSEFEKNIKISRCGAKASTVFTLGQPRYDSIFEQTYNKDHILMFFTWREGQQNLAIKEFKKTDYYLKIEEILTNKELHNYLKNKSKKLFFKVHPMIKSKEVFYNLDVSEQIILLSETENLTEVIRSSGVLITDYSSVAWDYIYNNRSVITYPFDYEKYSVSPGLYINVKEESVFNSVDSADSILSMLDYISGNTININKSEKFFEFDDKNNCERIYNEIIDRLN